MLELFVTLTAGAHTEPKNLGIIAQSKNTVDFMIRANTLEQVQTMLEQSLQEVQRTMSKQEPAGNATGTEEEKAPEWLDENEAEPETDDLFGNQEALGPYDWYGCDENDKTPDWPEWLEIEEKEEVPDYVVKAKEFTEKRYNGPRLTELYHVSHSADDMTTSAYNGFCLGFMRGYNRRKREQQNK